MRVNKFMLDQQVNKLINEKLQPVYNSQIECNHRIDTCLTGPYFTLRQSVEDLEMALFGSNSKTNKLAEMLSEMSVMKKIVADLTQQNKNQDNEHKLER